MSSVSRAKSRRFLFQVLYSQSQSQAKTNLKKHIEAFEQDKKFLDKEYFETLYKGIAEKELELLSLIQHYSPKFDVESLPAVHIVILFIGIYELLHFSDDVPENVAINEAIELGKRYSDDGAKNFINGVLNSVKMEKEKILKDSLKLPEISQGIL